MNKRWAAVPASIAVMVCIAAPVEAATPRDILLDAAFNTRDSATALARIAQAEAGANVQLARSAGDFDARLSRAMAIGYRAKLTRNRTDALSARHQFEALAAAHPRDAEAAAAVGTWHLDSVIQLGGLIAGMALGAKKAAGLAALDRAVALGEGCAMFPALAALLRMAIDPRDPRARALGEAAARGTTPEPIDRLMQRNVATALAALKSGKPDVAQDLAKELLPFGRVAR
jgi:hypothetical protein